LTITHRRRHLTRRPVTALSAVAMAAALAGGLAACGGGAKAATSSTTAPAPGSTAAPAGARAFPGTYGSVAAVTASSMEVQNSVSGQTTVDWTASTRWSQVLTLTAAAIRAGECVTVTGTKSGTAITARSVTVTPASTTGSCSTTAAGAFRGGPRPAGVGGGFAGAGGSSGSAPARSLPADLASVAVARGKVVSSSATALVVYGSERTGLGRFRRASTTSSSSTAPTTVPSTDIAIALTPSTTYTETKAVTSASVAVGDCVTATGPSDSTGAVTADAVRITSTGGQTCTAGFGGGGFGGGAGAQAASGAAGGAGG
jgi:hypothetical protein